MRRLVLLLSVAIALVPVGSVGASNGADIFGVGGGHIINNQFGTFDLSAHSSPTRDFGHVAYRDVSIDIYIDVNCLNAASLGSTAAGATLAGVVRRVSPVPNLFGIEPGDTQLMLINDGGNPSAPVIVGDPGVDAFYFIPIVGSPPSCKLVPPFFATPPNVSDGNITIKVG
jgi:hypothetical protein